MCQVIAFVPRKRAPASLFLDAAPAPEADELEFYEGHPIERQSGLLIIDAEELLADVKALWPGIQSGIKKLEASDIECDELRDRYDRIRGPVSICYLACTTEDRLSRGKVLVSKNQFKHVQSVVPTLKELAADVQAATEGLGNLVVLRAVAS
jgi:hypothetical protein